MSAGPLEAVAAELRALDASLAAATVEPGRDPGAARLGALAAGGARAEEHAETYALVVEAVREGSLLHYGEGRLLRSEDPDFALLAGDRLYALGLARLAETGDLEAVGELADVIALVAQAHAEDDPARADVIWEAGAGAVGTGTSPEHEAAKAAWRGTETSVDGPKLARAEPLGR